MSPVSGTLRIEELARKNIAYNLSIVFIRGGLETGDFMRKELDEGCCCLAQALNLGADDAVDYLKQLLRRGELAPSKSNFK